MSSTDETGIGDHDLLDATNNLLAHVGLVDFSSKSSNKVLSIKELQTVASSMFVAVYEARFHVRLEGIIRNPKNEADYARNAQLVISALQSKIHIALHHITGLSVAKGDRKALSNLVRIFLHLVSTQGVTSLSTSSDEEEGDLHLHGGIAEAARKRRVARKQRYAQSKLGMFKTAQTHGRPSSAKGGRKGATAPTDRSPNHFRNSTGGGGVADEFAGGGDTSTSFESTNSPSSVSYEDDEEDWYLNPPSRDRGNSGASGGRPTSRGAHRGSGSRPRSVPVPKATQSKQSKSQKKKISVSTEPPMKSTKELLAYKSSVMSSTIKTHQKQQHKEQSVHLGQLRQSYLKNSGSQGTAYGGPGSNSRVYRSKPMKIPTNSAVASKPVVKSTPARSGSPPLSQFINKIHASHRSKLASNAANMEVELKQEQQKAINNMAPRPQWDARSSTSSTTLGDVAMPLRKSINAELTRSYDDLIQLTRRLHSMCQHDSNKGVVHINNLQKLTSKLESAQRRREESRRIQALKSAEKQQKHEDVAQRVKLTRMEEQLAREAESFRQKLNNQDFVLLRTAYKDLLKQLHCWKIDEHREVRDRVGTMKENAKSHIQSLENLFEDRLAELREQAQSCHQLGSAGASSVVAAERESRVKKSTETLHTLSSTKKQQNMAQQQREKLMLERRESLSKLGNLKHVLVSNKDKGIVPRASASAASSADTSMEFDGPGDGNGLSFAALQRNGNNSAYDRYSARDNNTSGNGNGYGYGYGGHGLSRSPANTDLLNGETIRNTNTSADYYYVNIDNVVIPTTSTMAAEYEDADEISLHDGSTDISADTEESSNGIPSYSSDEALAEATLQMQRNQEQRDQLYREREEEEEQGGFGDDSQSQSEPVDVSNSTESQISDLDGQAYAYEYGEDGAPVGQVDDFSDPEADQRYFELTQPRYDGQYDDTLITARFEEGDGEVGSVGSSERSASIGSASTTDRRRL